MTGRLNALGQGEKMAVPVSLWVKYLHAIAGQGEYAGIPPKIEARIPEKEYYKGRGESSPVMDVLIQTGQFANVREQIRNSVTADYLTKEEKNGYMLLVDVLANGEWNALSVETRAEISKDFDLWMSPVAITSGAGGEIMLLPVTVATLNNHLDSVPDDILKSMTAHPSWNENKRAFLAAAVETRQMTDLLKRLGTDATVFWQSFTDNDLTMRDESGANLIYRFAEMGQAHLLPEKFWESTGVGAFTAVNPQTKLSPLYLISSTKDAAKNLTQKQMAILHQASRADWMYKGDMNVETPFFNAMYHKQPELLGDKVWTDLTRYDVVTIRSDGNSLAYWVGNAGAVDRIARLLRDDEKASLPTRDSVAATRTDWTDVMTLRNEADHGRIDKAKLMEIGPSGRTRLSDLIRSIPPAETVEKLLSRFTFEELTKIEGDRNEFPLMIIADAGFLKYVSSDVWFKIRTNPDILTRKANDGRFILDVAARDRNNKQLLVIPRNVLDSLPRGAYFMRNDRGGFPFIDAHLTAQDDALPFESGKFRPHDLMIRAPSKGDALMHMSLREAAMRRNGQLKEGEAGPMATVLKRFPFETWRFSDEFGETAILKLTQNAEMPLMPQAFRSRITSPDLETKGRYGDSGLYWLASDMYSEVKGTAVEWHHSLDLVDPAAVAGVKPETWTDRVRQASADDPSITEQTRNALKNTSFALLGSIRIGFLPPSSYRWTKEAFTQQDGTGNSVVKELYRQGKMDKDRLHDLARLGLLAKGTLTQKVGEYVTYTDTVVPDYILESFKDAESWLYKPTGALRSTFEEAVNHHQAASIPSSVRQSIPVERWYSRGGDGGVLVSKLIRQGATQQIPADYLYERPQFWTENMLNEVFDGGVWMGKSQEMKSLWEGQVGYIDMAMSATKDTEKSRMLKEKRELYQSFAPRFEENYKLAGGTVAPVSVPTPAPALP